MISIKGIWDERVEDAPFVGALISSVNCSYGCKNCFNQHIKDYPTIELDVSQIIERVKSNPFNQGVILAGLEWTEQPEEMTELIEECLKNDLAVMLYTGMSEAEFIKKFPIVYKQAIFIKFGRYEEENKTTGYSMFGINLSSTNQTIKGV